MSRLTGIITARDPEERNRSLDAVCAQATLDELLAECAALDRFRRASDNLYERVRALFFLYAIHRFHLPRQSGAALRAAIPFAGYTRLLRRRFEEAVDIFLGAQAAAGPSAAISSALAAGYRALGFQTLADQVRRSVRSVRGNQWMFRSGHPSASAANCWSAARPSPSSPSCAKPRPCAWTSPTAAGATFFSWAWIFPKARAF
jgi:hypothetical protein